MSRPATRLGPAPRAIGLMLAGAALGSGLAWAWGIVRAPVFDAEATLMVQTPLSPGTDTEGAVLANLARSPIVAALSVTTARVADVAGALGLDESPIELLRRISVRSEQGTALFTISVLGGDAEEVAAIANRLAALAEQGEVDVGGQTLLRVSIVEPALPPPNPAFARPWRDLATGAFVGAVVAGLLIRRRSPGPAASRSSQDAQLHLRELAIGVAAAAAIVAAMAVGVAPVVARGLTAASGALAVVSPAAGLAFLTVMLPLRDPTGFGPLTVDLVVTAGVVYGSVLQALIARDRIALTPRALAAVAFVGLAAIGAIPALNGLHGEQAVGPMASSLQLGCGFLLAGAAAYQFRRIDARPYVLLCVVTGALAALMAGIQLLAPSLGSLPAPSLYPPPDAINPGRPGGPFENANYFGLLAAISLIAAVGAWSMLPRWRPLVMVAALPLVVALGAIALSRGAVVAVTAGLIVYLLGISRTHVRAAIMPAMVLALIMVVVVPVVLSARSEGAVSDGKIIVQAPATSDSDRQRLNAMAAAVPMFASDPLFGIGYGQYSLQSRRFLRTTPVTAAHTQYLDSFAEQGLVGVGALACLLAAVITGLRQASAGLGVLGASLLATYAVGALFLEPLASLQTSGTFFIVIGAVLASGTPPLVAGEQALITTRRPLRRSHRRGVG